MRRVMAPVFVLLLLAACSTADPKPGPSAAASGAPRAGSGCPDLAAQGRPVAFSTPAGTRLAGIELGGGTTGIVLAHQNQSSLCEWILHGKRLAERGYRVLAFDFAGDGDSGSPSGDDRLDDDVVAAATHLRGTGTTNIVLMGASKGGAASLAAAVTLSPPPAAVVTLSAPKLFAGVSAAEAVPQLKSPALFLCGESDQPFADAAQEFDAAAPKSVPHQVFLPIGGEHGTGLLAGGQAKKVNDLLDGFLAQHAPTS
jgi:pimeloyl-ACP methyl ester carboxylesterase